MTPQETHALQDLLHQLVQVRGITKDPDADALISRAVAQQPDAPYLLVQRAMLLEQALTSAKARITQLENECEANRSRAMSTSNAGGSFLDSATAWGRSAVSPARHAEMPSPQGQMPAEQQAPMPGGAARRSFLGGGGSSFLGNMAATAAGVAGGAFLFHGIGSLLGNHDQASNLAGKPGMAPDSASLAENDTAKENAPADDTAANDGYSDADYTDNGGGFDGFDSGGDMESI
ncbi:MAG: hypothetical protein JWQ00_1260 [Noviherbaspirillum sp.]|jgi:hypothetical protein|nr:hypothetical protein [Noviherbaspirillum sp.]